MAVREGIEPPVELPPRRISSAVQSTTLPPLREVVPLPPRAAGRDGRAYGIASEALQHSIEALPTKAVSVAALPVLGRSQANRTGSPPQPMIAPPLPLFVYGT